MKCYIHACLREYDWKQNTTTEKLNSLYYSKVNISSVFVNSVEDYLKSLIKHRPIITDIINV